MDNTWKTLDTMTANPLQYNILRKKLIFYKRELKKATEKITAS
jgi:hypothetical protein